MIEFSVKLSHDISIKKVWGLSVDSWIFFLEQIRALVQK